MFRVVRNKDLGLDIEILDGSKNRILIPLSYYSILVHVHVFLSFQDFWNVGQKQSGIRIIIVFYAAYNNPAKKSIDNGSYKGVIKR